MQNNSLPIYWKWSNELPISLIDVLLKEMETLEFVSAMVGGAESGSVNEDIRKSKVHLTPPLHWMAGILHNYGIHANTSSAWNFTLSIPETCQITKYGCGEFYDFHTDNEPVSSTILVRKISVACCISSSDSYDGGEFVFNGVPPIKMDKGDILVFPSATLHKVNPVLSGERISLITWILGPNNK